MPGGQGHVEASASVRGWRRAARGDGAAQPAARTCCSSRCASIENFVAQFGNWYVQ